MDPIVLTVIEHALRAIAALGPGILAAILDTADDDAALALARERARGAVARIRATPADDAVRDAIAAHAERTARGDEPTRETPLVSLHDRRVVERMLAAPAGASHEERAALRALLGKR